MSNLEIPGSLIIGGLLLLSMISLYFFFNNFTGSKNVNAIIQTSSIELKKVIDYDFNKIGYRSANKKIAAIDSTSISFNADLDNNGVVDTVRYSFNNGLIRTVNPGSKSFRFRAIDKFKIVGYDSLNNITYQSNKIKNLLIQMHFNGQEFLADTNFTALSYLEARYNILN